MKRTYVAALAALVGLVYALPLLASYARQGRLLYAAAMDEILYNARVVDAYRGGSLGNPYLAEHQAAPHVMPDVTERSLAWAAHVFRIGPLEAVAVSRVLFPVAIFLLLFFLGRNLGLSPPLAVMAGMLATLASGHSQLIPGAHAGLPVFLRYFRPVSPGAYTIAMLAALLLLEKICRRETAWWWVILTGLALGELFYTQVYYWALLFAGAGWMVLRADAPARPRILAALALGALLGAPSLWRARRLMELPEVRDTVYRIVGMAPGRDPDPLTPRYFLVGLLFAAPVAIGFRQLGRTARFLLPFLVLGTLFFRQNIVTNLHMESHHWANCLIPLWGLVIAALWQIWPRAARPPIVWTCAAALVVFAVAVQSVAYVRMEKLQQQKPEIYDLPARMPMTLEWLNRQTPPGSVVLSNEDIMTTLPLFTHNKVYYSIWAFHHAVSRSEEMSRIAGLKWRPAEDRPLRYRAEYYLGSGEACSPEWLYRNDKERTCVRVISARK